MNTHSSVTPYHFIIRFNARSTHTSGDGWNSGKFPGEVFGINSSGKSRLTATAITQVVARDLERPLQTKSVGTPVLHLATSAAPSRLARTNLYKPCLPLVDTSRSQGF